MAITVFFGATELLFEIGRFHGGLCVLFVIGCVDEIAEALNAGPDGASTSPREQPHSTPQCAPAMAELGGREEDACERMHMRDLM